MFNLTDQVMTNSDWKEWKKVKEYAASEMMRLIK